MLFTSPDELEEAKELILAVKPDIAAFDSDAYEDNMVTGDNAMVLGWSGDVFTAQVEDENIDYAMPQEGVVKWIDNLCITADAAADPDRLERAYLWIDFLNRPEIAAMNTDYVWYASPNAAAEDMIDPEILSYEAIYGAGWEVLSTTGHMARQPPEGVFSWAGLPKSGP